MKYRSAPLLKLLLTDRGQARGIILMAAFAGTANAALLSIVNTATSAQNKEGLLRMMVLFLIAFVLFAYCSVETFQRATMLVEKGIERVRLRITDKIARIDLHGLQKVDPAVLHGRLTQDTQAISDSGGVTAAALQSAVLITFTTIYMAFLSLPTFILGAIMIGGGLMVYVVRARTVNERIESAARREADYFDRINDLVHGFKELKLSDQRRDALAADIHATVGEVRRLKIETSDLYNRNYIFAYSLFYLLIGVVVFILPRFVQSQGKQLTELTATILFIIGPLSTVVAAIPAWSRSNLAAQRLLTLDEQLEGMYEVSPKLKSTKGRMLAPFETIELRNVVFQFSGGNGNGSSFTVGPINFTIHAGETLFIVGGNGSGKSTLLKLLTALYVPKSGQLLVDGMPVDARNRQAYRNLFSAIFSDFYLFRKMYGIDAVDAPLVADLLQMMRIENKTTFDGTGFSTLDLSTGQRKRLAMIVALIEDRPICVFDEWAADQDPEFRGYFYHSLLPSLKEKGKTVIVVSHDDRYFNVGDRVLHMEYGRVDRVLAGSEV
ncbi:MAG: cyclic peptide export ABC transporter [Thermoanaerobaculia bacterium]